MYGCCCQINMTSHYDTNIFCKKKISSTQCAQSARERNVVYNTSNKFDRSLNFTNKVHGEVGRNLSLDGYAKPLGKKGDELLANRKTRNFLIKNYHF